MLLDRHRSKIVAPDQLVALLGARPRARTVVLCCGVFDVVHPGHLRHLAYARQRADVLVCGVTADARVAKGPHRPHVPEDLRAANLAMLDIVDYVLVVDETVPLRIIAALQPDYYAKGFEYSGEARRGRPIPEAAVVEAYGGEVLFTPGDVVYSSTALIEDAAPDLRWEKLAMLMRTRELSFGDLRRAVAAMRGQRVHVVGDAIVDALLRCEVIGASGKTPTVSVRRVAREQFAGGAVVVAKHLRAAGAAVQLSTVVGGDDAGKFILDDAQAAGVAVYPVADRARPTTVKEAVVVDGYRLLKIDEVDNRPVSGAILRRLREQVAETAGGAVVLSDFRHGIFHGHSIGELTSAIPAGCLRTADSQVASRWGNICDFRGFDLITPNEREARFALGDQDSGVRPLAERLHAAAGCRWLLMKMGARGMLAYGERTEDCFVLDSHARAAVDPVGAGDAFLAYATLSLLARPGDLACAAVLGTFAAGAECERDGNVPVGPEYVLCKIDDAEREIGG